MSFRPYWSDAFETNQLNWPADAMDVDIGTDTMDVDETPTTPVLPHPVLLWLRANHSGWMKEQDLWANAMGMDLLYYLTRFWSNVVTDAVYATGVPV